jgi:hypothetical protein
VKRIEKEEQYEKARMASIDMSIKLQNPLFTGPERDKLMRIYDITVDELQVYRRGEMVQMFPGLAKQYDDLGWDYRKPVEPQQQEKPAPPETTSAAAKRPPEEKPKQTAAARKKPVAGLTSWLED